ncbi:uncharacterized protein LOC113356077 [Papaver somniferum]|uniref:uncharacterized protein LOC113356077 n=1 Tax=Papaver somniferum TaxID=3469 RepID=UPI000E6FCD4E|nr:uncharacterized protein LOC113356077 [Papaver somniferum]
MSSFITLTPNFSSLVSPISNPNKKPLLSINNGSLFLAAAASSFPSNFSQLISVCSSFSSSRSFLQCVSSSSSSDVTPSEFPLLPFGADEVLVPTESKTLHLYEARFLALLEESLISKNKLFVHFVLDPIISSATVSGTSFAARYGCLVLIENVERLEIGALVSIRGIGRVKIVNFNQADPYLKGVVIPLQDNVPDSMNKISSDITKLKESLYQLNSLQIKLKASKDESLQTQITNSLRWAEKESSIYCDESFIPSLAERLSFAGLQPVSGFSQSESEDLQREKLEAMEMKDTSKRIEKTLEFIKQNTSMVAAKLAIQSLGVQ